MDLINSFDGLAQNNAFDPPATFSAFDPPDPNAAAGPSQVVEMVNAEMALFDKSTGSLLAKQSLPNFFSRVGATPHIFDPIITYDELAGRFIAATLELGPGNNSGFVNIAVSNTSTPTNFATDWTEMHRIEVTELIGGTTLVADYDRVGWNADTIVVTMNMKTRPSNSNSHVQLLTIEKATLLDQNNAPLTDYRVDVLNFTTNMQPANMHGSTTGDPLWFVHAPLGSSTSIQVIKMTNVLSPTPTFVISNVSVPAYQSPPLTVPNGSATVQVGNVGASVLSAELRGGRLVGTQTVRSGSAAHARWYDFNIGGAAPTLNQSGAINPGPGISTYWAAIAIAANGDLGMTYMESSAAEYVSMHVTGRTNADAPGTMQTPVLVRAGLVPHSGRSGDYSGINVDPVTGTSFWAASEYVPRNGQYDTWATHIANFNLDLDPEPLRIATFTPTSTGFVAFFNRPADLGNVNLYDVQGGGLGPADVTLIGAANGPVRGSLVFDPAGLRVTFLRTGGELPADTYTATLRSAANGFRTTTGTLLDGNNDGLAGDDYVISFTVAPSTAVTVRVPDFMRGPGQFVILPASSVGLPLRLSDGAEVTSVNLVLTFAPGLLSITAAGAPAGAAVTLDTSTPGQAVLGLTSPTALGPGPIDFVVLTARVPDTAPYTSKQVLDIGSVQINGGTIPARDDDGLHVVGYPGDTTGNAGYSSGDAVRALRVAVGLDSGFAAYRLADPVIVADVSGNGFVNSSDATRILQEAVGIDRPEIPPLPGVIPPIVPGGPDPLLNIPKSFRSKPGRTITVPVNLDLSDGLQSADLALSYDVSQLDVLSISDVRRGNLTRDFDLFAVNLDRRAGTIRVGMGRTAGPISGRGSGSVLRITFHIRPDSPRGPAVLNLRHGLGNTMTQLNEGALVLTPAPDDAVGDVLDGLITVRRNGT